LTVAPKRPADGSGPPHGDRRRRPDSDGLSGPKATNGADAAGKTEATEDNEESETAERQAKAPWHFKVIAVGSVVYLGWRLYQGIGWLVHHI
jgi:hypothetical protein